MQFLGPAFDVQSVLLSSSRRGLLVNPISSLVQIASISLMHSPEMNRLSLARYVKDCYSNLLKDDR